VIARRAKARLADDPAQASRMPNVSMPILGFDDVTGSVVVGWRRTF
jgi:hypothetical protein